MRIVFFGTSEFAIPSLNRLLGSGFSVCAVVTQPDRKRGRNLVVSPPPTKVIANSHGIPVFQPADASGRGSVSYLRSLEPDLFIVISFGQILKREVLDIPRLYALNLHGSLLPRLRGAAPTNWSIMNGDKTSGITIIRMNERMDGGDIALKRETLIEDVDTNITLSERLSETGADALIEFLLSLKKGATPSFTKQDDSIATYAPKLRKQDGLIKWDEPARRIHNKVRALLPWPAAYTHLDNKLVRVLVSEVRSSDDKIGGEPGLVVGIERGGGIVVRTGDGDLVVKFLQLEGKKALDADSFLRGHRIGPGTVLG